MSFHIHFFDRHHSLDSLKQDQLRGLRVFYLKQVHGARVWSTTSFQETEHPEGDAMVTTDANCALTVHTADCIPLLAHGSLMLGACHGGWRSVQQGIIDAWLNAFEKRGEALSHLQVWLGPSIGVCHFEVGVDVADALMATLPVSQADRMAVIRRSHRDSAKAYIDLKQLVMAQLEARGVKASHIHLSEDCTYCGPKKYWSYRRDGAHIGRLEAVIWKDS